MMTLLVRTKDIEVLNGRILIIPMIALVRRRLTTFIGRPVQVSIWWPEFWGVISTPQEPPLDEPERSSSEEGELEDPLSGNHAKARYGPPLTGELEDPPVR